MSRFSPRLVLPLLLALSFVLAPRPAVTQLPLAVWGQAICGQPDGDDQPGEASHQLCGACLLAAVALLPESASLPDRAVVGVPLHGANLASLVVPRPWRGALWPRAPPVM